jgi:hypothetical protein
MAEHDKIEFHEKPRIEEHYIYALLAIPIFLVSIFIIFLIATFGTK